MRFGILVSIVVGTIVVPGAVRGQATPNPEACAACHAEISPGLHNQWQNSRHGAEGVTCIDCHGADASEPDAFLHEGAYVATLVTPRDCGQCHEQEAAEVERSYHATAGLILESNDAYLAHVAAGQPVAIAGCESCHGTKVQIDPASPNKLSSKSWPNSGIGRLNPDGSKGSCSACHTRHSFSKAQARQPEACSKCHLGPDHPQKEVYEESKHGNAYYTNVPKMNLDDEEWIVGVDYFVAPTCATCHMSATLHQERTHDVGARISWTLRPPISKHTDSWEEKRGNMRDVCSACHGPRFVDGHYYQYDAVVRLYNEEVCRAGDGPDEPDQERHLLENPASFSNEIEWTYWELWHHEGRRARHGAAMMGPDYTWWHGLYEVAQHFYFKMIPEARALDDPEVNAWIDSLLVSDEHAWLHKETAVLKEGVRSGDLQKIYSKLFEEQP
ncbi:MAG: multiheme c-type cytochrome [Candidatus Eisenbacteria bacterium]